MPRGGVPGKRQNNNRVTHITLKAVVITLRLFSHDSFQEIERKTGVKASTAQHIWQQAKERAGNEHLLDLLACLERKKQLHRRTKAVNGSEESVAIRTRWYVILNNPAPKKSSADQDLVRFLKMKGDYIIDFRGLMSRGEIVRAPYYLILLIFFLRIILI